jgi:hypothetical protein
LTNDGQPFSRQDDCSKQRADFVKFAADYKEKPNTTGVLITFMGDGMPAFMALLAKEMEPIVPQGQGMKHEKKSLETTEETAACR